MRLVGIFSFLMAVALVCGCGGGGNGAVWNDGDTIVLRYAENLTLVDFGGFVKADFRNPWDTTRTLQTFLLVPRDGDVPAGLPEGTVVRVPIERAVVYTSVHNNLVCELGAMEAIVGICDTKYIHRADLRQRIDDGTVVDCGSSMTPNIERILMLRPDALLLSAFENSNDHNKVGQIGIPIIDCTDYMESSPLARAEWMRFYGRLFGRGDVADSLFNITERAYLSLKEQAKGVAVRPTVLTDLIWGQSWNIPGALSTTGVMIEDAGGRNPFEEYRRSGSVQLAPEEVLFKAKDADIWLLKYSQNVPLTISQLGRDNDIYTKFRPYDTGNVYACNSDQSSYFEEAAFHPHWVLAELVALFHPELELDTDLNRHYYQKMER